MDSEFSERQFELVFNGEVEYKYKSLLFNPPFPPTLNEEADLGYDVQYDFKKGFKVRSLMLQFKVSHYIEKCSGNNVHIYHCYNGAYFRFSIMKRCISKQHAIMLKLARSGKAIFYCAPLFYRVFELDNFFHRSTVINNSRCFDPIDMGNLPDDRQHHVSFDPLGRFGFFHSKSEKVVKVLGLGEILPLLDAISIDEEYILEFKEQVLKMLMEEYVEFLGLPDKFKELSVFYQIKYLLRTYLDIDWFLIPS